MPARKKPTARKSSAPDFEQSLAELEEIVERMEQGEQSLDETIRDFERGMVLSELCRKSLGEAQQKVEKLVKKHGQHRFEPVDDLEDGFDDAGYDDEED